MLARAVEPREIWCENGENDEKATLTQSGPFGCTLVLFEIFWNPLVLFEVLLKTLKHFAVLLEHSGLWIKLEHSGVWATLECSESLKHTCAHVGTITPSKAFVL